MQAQTLLTFKAFFLPCSSFRSLVCRAVWSGLSVQVRRHFPLSTPASVPQVVPLGVSELACATSRAPEGLSSSESLWWVPQRESETLLDRPALTTPPPRPRQPRFLPLTPWRRGQRMLGLCR